MKLHKVQLGGKYAISYPIGLFFLPILILSTPLIAKREHADGTFNQWLFATSLGTFIAALFLYIFDKTALSDREENPIPNEWIFYLGGFVGAVKGIVTEWLMLSVFHASGITLVTMGQRAFSGAAIGAVYMPTIALVNYSWNYLRTEAKISANELANLDELIDSIKDPTLEAKFVEETQKRLSEAKRDFLKKFEGVNSVDPDEVHSYLRDAAENIVRPLSKKVKANRKRFGWIRDWSRVSIFYPLSVENSMGVILTVYGITRVRDYIVMDGFVFGSMNIALDVLMLWFALITFVWYSTFESSTPTSRGVIFCALIAAQGYFHSLIAFGKLHDHQHDLFIDFLWTSFVVAFTAFGGIYFQVTMDELKNLESVVSRRYLEILRKDQSDAAQSAALARYLHGTLQTRLVTSAYRIRNLGEFSGTSLQEEITNAASHFDLPLDASNAVKSTDNNSNWYDQWSALMNIHRVTRLNPDEFNPDSVAVVREVLNEALSNAYRHGHAENVWISGEFKGDVFELTVTDDGVGFEKIERGFGTELFDSIMNKEWSLTRLGDKTVLSGKLRLER